MEGESAGNYIAQEIADRLKASGLSARALALEMGLSHPTVVALSRGTTEVQFLTLRKVAQYFQWGPGETGVAALTCEPVKPAKRKKKRSTSTSGPR